LFVACQTITVTEEEFKVCFEDGNERSSGPSLTAGHGQIRENDYLIGQVKEGQDHPVHSTRSLRPPTLVSVLTVVVLAACNNAPPGVDVYDPYEQVNRQVHEFNVGLDQAVIDPAGQVANTLAPPVRESIVNFSHNVSMPGAVFNGILQGDIEGAATNTMRFLINSTVGILGIFDPAGVIGLEEHETDFGETLAVWGFPEGAFIMLPVLGPSNERDAVGEVVDFYLDPLQIFGGVEVAAAVPEVFQLDTVAWAGEQVIERGQFDDTFDDIYYNSADGYAQLRLAYVQNRRYELGQTAQTPDPTADPAAAEEYYFDPYQDQ
jgi:phospholipid-binding lipoprotein MlaA